MFPQDSIFTTKVLFYRVSLFSLSHQRYLFIGANTNLQILFSGHQTATSPGPGAPVSPLFVSQVYYPSEM